MNWPLVFLLSLFGLVMGVATVFVIGPNVEPIVWLVIFAISAYAIAKAAPGRHLLHGAMVGIVNSFWITTCHILLVDRYLAGHEREAGMLASGPMADSPRLMMAMVGPVIGVVSGLVIGGLAVLASRMVKPRPA